MPTAKPLIVTTIICAVVLTAAQSIVAYSQPPEARETAHIVYDNESAPDWILYYHFLDGLQIGNRGQRVRHLNPGMTSNSNPDVLTNYFKAQYKIINSEIREAKTEILSCSNGTHSQGLRASQVQALNEVVGEVYAKHLALSKVELARDSRFDLQAAIDGSPSAFQIKFVDHALLLHQSVDAMNAVVRKVCEDLNTKPGPEMISNESD